MKYWEINGNLDDELSGIANYRIFQNAVCATKLYFDRVFGSDFMNQIPFYVDNATADSGYTPISTPVLGKLVIIKLGIKADDGEAKVAYQFAHELTHVVFRAYFGIGKPRATEDEEAICTASSLIIIKKLYPNHFEAFERSAMSHSYVGYQKGVPLAKALAYDMTKIRSIIEASNPVPTPLLGHRCRSSQEITGSPTPFSTSNHYLWICPRASFSLSNPNIAA